MRDLQFGDLSIGEVFVFAAESEYPGMARGPWQKTGARTYERVSDRLSCKVGTIKVAVAPLPLVRKTNG